MRRLLIAVLALLLPTAALAQNAAITDPPRDAAHRPQPVAFVLKAPDGAGAMNALLWQAGGAGAHPTLLLFHGFPGNEQNLDLAQAARRAGWHVLTLHYRGSWGSPGTFRFTQNPQDLHAVLTYLRDPAQARALRERLLATRMTVPLFNPERFARHIEAAYTTMWETWQRGEAPKAFAVPAIS